jgi:hypothetical protein
MDRELLELAAKAAGIPGTFDPFMGKFRRYLEGQSTFVGAVWDPLDNNGDAFELQVRLGMNVSHLSVVHWPESSAGRKEVMVGYRLGPEKGSNVTQPVDDDPYAATRRAIVEAAAEVARRSEA